MRAHYNNQRASSTMAVAATTGTTTTTMVLLLAFLLVLVTSIASTDAMVVTSSSSSPPSSSSETVTPPTTVTMTNHKNTPQYWYHDYEELRGSDFDKDVLAQFFFRTPGKQLERTTTILNRFVQVFTTVYQARQNWILYSNNKPLLDVSSNNTGTTTAATTAVNSAAAAAAAIQLCDSVGSLGPLAVKLGQTLSQRPDIVPKSVCDALKRLQTQNTPFDNEVAYQCLRDTFQHYDGPLATNIIQEEDNNTASQRPPLFEYLSKDPIASASLGQVYRGTMIMHNKNNDDVDDDNNGNIVTEDVAVKVQRPDALAIIAIDVQCFRIVFDLRATFIDVTEQWNNLLVVKQKQGSASSTTTTTTGGMTEEEVRAEQGEEGTIPAVIDRVAKDIMKELDYCIEAENAKRFQSSLQFIGFVTTPDVVYASQKILMTKFIYDGYHLSDLSDQKQKLALTRMAVEACTASMVLTGFVHADPHEGNLMYRTSTKQLVFLDFGLMSDVSQTVMESFARGIQALLSEDFVAMTEAFQDTEFITTPIMHRTSTSDLWNVDPKYQLPQLATELEYYMKTTTGGLSRFGALTTVLNKKISPNWLVFTPPYVLLLIRTFLTLEGIAGQVDPEFNIYEMSLPWVVRRSLSPSTVKGTNVLRNTILKTNNKIQWERLVDLMDLASSSGNGSSSTSSSGSTNDDDTKMRQQTESSQSSKTTTSKLSTNDSVSTPQDNDSTSTFTEPDVTVTTSVTTASDITSNTVASTAMPSSIPENEEVGKAAAAQKQEEYADARNAAMKDAIGTLLGSYEGKALRGVLKDLDTPDLLWKLGCTKEGRPMVKMATSTALNKLFSPLSVRRRSFLSLFRSRKQRIKNSKKNRYSSSSMSNPIEEEDDENEEENYRPMSDECQRIRDRQLQRTNIVKRILLQRQIKACLYSWKGWIGLSRLSLSVLQITVSILVRKFMQKMIRTTTIPRTSTTTITASS